MPLRPEIIPDNCRQQACSQHRDQHIDPQLDRTELARSAVAAPGGDRFTVTLTPEEIQSRASQPGPLRLVFVGDLIRRKVKKLVRAGEWA